MPQTDDLLSLRGVSQRSVSYRFVVLDRDDRPIGEVHPNRDDFTPVITQDTDRFIQRDVQNLLLPPDERGDVNPLEHRIQPFLVAEDSTEVPLGVFLFAEVSRPRYSYGSRLSGTVLVDKGVILDQQIEHSISFPAGTDARAAMIVVLREALDDRELVISGSHTSTTQQMAWPPGTMRSQVLTDLALVGAYLPPYFDRHGVCHVRALREFHVGDFPIESGVTYRDGDNIYAASIIESDELLEASNRYIVINSNPEVEGVVGVFDVPADAPFSEFRRGFRTPNVQEQQGVGTTADANTAARAWGTQDAKFEFITFIGPPDPRHDAWTAVEFRGDLWLEQSWVLTCAPAGPMEHVVRRVYD